MKNKYTFFMAIALMLVAIIISCWNLILFQNENNMLKNELDAKNAECTALVNKNLLTSKNLESVENELAIVKNELEEVKKELVSVKTDNLKWSGKYNKYPAATIAWVYMTEELGWSDVVAAGIIGNMMTECGGQTLKLNWDSNGSSGYGLIQWIGGRRNSIKAKYGEKPTVVEQIEFVKDELYGTNGVRQQVTDKQRELILNATSPEQCASYFAKWFERPASNNYSKREANAAKAYAYFCGEN